MHHAEDSVEGLQKHEFDMRPIINMICAWLSRQQAQTKLQCKK